jgi:hypothetical protein
MFSFFKKKSKTPEELIRELENSGFQFNSESAKQAALLELDDYSGNGVDAFEATLCAMGDEQYDLEEDKLLPWLSDDVWHFDFEAIEDHGAYVSIVKNCIRVSRGALSLSSLKDYVDVEKGVAKISFVSNGKSRSLDLEVDNDWADPMLFVRLNEILDEAGSNRWFFKHDLGQDCLITCKVRSDIESINSATGLNFLECRA